MGNQDDPNKVKEASANLTEAPESADDPRQGEVDEQAIAIQARAETAADIGYNYALDALRECKTLPEFFEKLRKETEKIIFSEPRFKEILSGFEGEAENILEAVRSNDFSTLDNKRIPKDSEQYGLVLRLAAIKNDITAELVQKALSENGERLGVAPSEQKLILGFMGMIKEIDEIYIKWRAVEMFPKKLRQDPEFKGDKATDYVEEHELDDPYAVVREVNGVYECVSYSIVFQAEYEKLNGKVDALIKELENCQESDFGDKLSKEKTLIYLKAYKAALNCKESKKVGKEGEWKSVSLWKAVDKAWLACQNRLQFIHGIESGYEKKIDRTEKLIIPELKLALQHTSPQTDNFLQTMKNDNVKALKTLLQNRGNKNAKSKAKSLEPMRTSHVALVSVISGGGNSMDGIGCAQVGPNYEDVVAKYGIKAYISAYDLFDGEKLRDTVAREVFGNDVADQQFQFLKDESTKNHYIADFIGGHEVGHVFAEMDVDKVDELKATWTAMVAIRERERQGVLTPGLSDAIMRSHVEYCLKYLADTLEEKDDYGTEGIVNVKLFLKTGLITRDGENKYSFHPEKIEDMYREIEAQWLEFANLYGAKGPKPEYEYEEWRRNLLGVKGYKTQLVELAHLADNGKKRYNREKKA